MNFENNNMDLLDKIEDGDYPQDLIDEALGRMIFVGMGGDKGQASLFRLLNRLFFIKYNLDLSDEFDYLEKLYHTGRKEYHEYMRKLHEDFDLDRLLDMFEE